MPAPIHPKDEWQDRLLKSIPAEFVGAFLAINSLVQNSNLDDDTRFQILVWAGVVMLLALPFYQRRVRKITAPGQLIASCLAFVIWGLNISIAITGTFKYSSFIWPILMIMWGVIAPILTVQKDAGAEPPSPP
jgi:hypothetical protein